MRGYTSVPNGGCKWWNELPVKGEAYVALAPEVEDNEPEEDPHDIAVRLRKAIDNPPEDWSCHRELIEDSLREIEQLRGEST